MNRLLFLALALLCAGCIKPDPALTQASTVEPPTPEPAAPAPPSPTPQPIPTQPTGAPTPPANQTNQTAPPPPPPAKPADHHAEQEGFIVVTPPQTSMTVDMAFPVLAGARNLTVSVVAFAVAPDPAPVQPPAAPANVTLTLRAPDGTVLATLAGTLGEAQPTVTLEWGDLAAAGEYHAIIGLTGVSDGSSAGDKYHALVHVAY